VKGLVLAGGTGSRLWPITLGVSKQLIPVYDKPMIYYPLSTLMLSGCKEIGVISSEEHLKSFQRLLGDGSHLGVAITYLTQSSPKGLADAYLVSEEYLGGEASCLALGDNLFYGQGLGSNLRKNIPDKGARVFGYRVSNPQDYGVVETNSQGSPLRLIEKPSVFVSDLAIPGLYFMDATAPARASRLTPSPRGELEITDLLQNYLDEGALEVSVLPRGTVWLDTGNFDSMAEATEYVRVVQKREGRMIASPEEIAWRLGWIDDTQLKSLGDELLKSGYGRYLLQLLDGEK
jgi:glucose-1-phosphate thymidylyltransferase